ncbi:hypothetical protein C8J56DRAFT_1051704 [Mycena floridula]|nr:hypothetical protein C8J56DRAFT_1051704 [Mycena floridula]
MSYRTSNTSSSGGVAQKGCFVVAGTGQGKTLSGILNQILEPEVRFSLVLSPLKWLQSSQAEDLQLVYRLKAMIVNEDTPRNTDFWNKKAHSLGRKRPGTARIVIATPEHFHTPEGYMTISAITFAKNHSSVVDPSTKIPQKSF